MTGVGEAVSNGVTAFRDPVVKTAQRTLTAIIAILIVLLAGIAFLCRAYQVGATNPGPGYPERAFRSLRPADPSARNSFYFVYDRFDPGSCSHCPPTRLLRISPALCRLVAEDGYLPTPLAIRGRTARIYCGYYHPRYPLRGAFSSYFGGNNGPTHSPVRRWGFPGVYIVAGWHGRRIGGARGGAGRSTGNVRERARRRGDRQAP